MSTLSHTSGCHTPEKSHISMETEEWQLFCISLVRRWEVVGWQRCMASYCWSFFSRKKFYPRGHGYLETGYVLHLLSLSLETYREKEKWSRVNSFIYLALFFFLSQVTSCHSPAQIASSPEEVALYFWVLNIFTLQSSLMVQWVALQPHRSRVSGLILSLGYEFSTFSPCPPKFSPGWMLSSHLPGWSETRNCPWVWLCVLNVSSHWPRPDERV